MQYGLSDEVIKKIQQIFTENNVVEKVILFGSRAKGNFKQGSDIDLAIIGNKIGMQEMVALKTALEKINLPIEFDLVNFKTIAESALIEHIERVGVAIYQK